MVSLGPRFEVTLTVVALLIALFLVTFFLAVFLLRGAFRPTRRPARWDRRQALKVIGALLLITLPIGVIGIGNAIVDHRTRPQDAEAALEAFGVEYQPDVDKARLERTLAEFERIRRDFTKQWGIPDSSLRIRLDLFRDAYDYRAYTSRAWGIDWASGHAQCLENEITIGVPLEEASTVFEELPISSTLAHEMVHATWCQKLGTSSYRSIPRWFHEGMAKRYGNEGINRLGRKGLNRWAVWLNRKNLLPVTQFCSYQLTGGRTTIGLFYATSWEFIRSLEASHGIQSINAIVEDVGDGRAFEDSLRDRLGGTCSELYREWTQSF